MLLWTHSHVRHAGHPLLLSRAPACKAEFLISRCPRRALLHALPDGGERVDGGISGPQSPPPPSAGSGLLLTSTISYTAMTAAGIWLGDATGRVHVQDFFAADWQLGPALLWTAALLPYPVISTRLADSVEAFAEVRSLFKAAIIPTLETLPTWGIALLALGAGVGEETFFRGFLQTAAVSGLADWAGGGLSHGAATALGVAAVSLFFGALHAATWLYFVFATVAGALFGIEFLQHGLPAAAITHALYDFVALVYIVRAWGGGSSSKGLTTGN